MLSSNSEKKEPNGERLDLKTSIKPTGKYDETKDKDRFTKSSFWANENTP